MGSAVKGTLLCFEISLEEVAEISKYSLHYLPSLKFGFKANIEVAVY